MGSAHGWRAYNLPQHPGRLARRALMGHVNEVHTAEFAAIKALCYQGLDSVTLR
jgi:hypothetical protein